MSLILDLDDSPPNKRRRFQNDGSYLRVLACVYVCLSVCVYVHVFVYVHVCVSVCVWVCVCVLTPA